MSSSRKKGVANIPGCPQPKDFNISSSNRRSRSGSVNRLSNNHQYRSSSNNGRQSSSSYSTHYNYRRTSRPSQEGLAGGNTMTPSQSDACPVFSHKEKPLDVAAVGWHAWHYLHTVAAYYPDNPTAQQQRDMANFINLVGEFYPCKNCAAHFKQQIARAPPQTQNRDALAVWFCERHNEVNRQNNKPIFPCNKQCIEKRWGPEYE